VSIGRDERKRQQHLDANVGHALIRLEIYGYVSVIIAAAAGKIKFLLQNGGARDG